MKHAVQGPWALIFSGDGVSPSEILLIDGRCEGDESAFDVFFVNQGPDDVVITYGDFFLGSDERHEAVPPNSSMYLPNATFLRVSSPDGERAAVEARGTWQVVRTMPCDRDAPRPAKKASDPPA